MKKYFVLPLLGLISLMALSACSSEPDKAPLEGERISILDLQQELHPATNRNPADIIDVPTVIKNKAWPQNGGYPHHSMQNLYLGDSAQLEKIWSVSIGKGSSKQLPLTARPVAADGMVYTLDTASKVRAFHDQTGKKIWEADVSFPKEDDPVISGGLAYDEGTIYVTSGYDEVIALNSKSGEIKWRTPVSAGSRAAPTIKNGRVFVVGLNNNAIALDAQSGKVLWEYEGVGETTGLLGAASPTADDQLVIPAFSSGDLVALRVENGSVVWSDNLANSLRLGGMAGLSDIRGLPVMNGDMVMAISYGGRMAAYDKRNGNLVWQAEISSAETPWTAGNTVYVLSADYNLMALDIKNGEILWITSVPKYSNSEKREGLITWTGPLMVGGRVVIAGSTGHIIEFNPLNGQETTRWDVKKSIYLTPIVANGTLYMVSNDGSLLAYR